MVQVTEQPIDVGRVIASVAGDDAGGTVVFLGTVRNESEGRAVSLLELEAYVPMAERKLAEIAVEAQASWGARVAIAHRIGPLQVGEVIVAIAAACPHRAEAFAACRYAIDTLKDVVPIWKKEHGPDGAEWVE